MVRQDQVDQQDPPGSVVQLGQVGQRALLGLTVCLDLTEPMEFRRLMFRHSLGAAHGQNQPVRKLLKLFAGVVVAVAAAGAR